MSFNDLMADWERLKQQGKSPAGTFVAGGTKFLNDLWILLGADTLYNWNNINNWISTEFIGKYTRYTMNYLNYFSLNISVIPRAIFYTKTNSAGQVSIDTSLPGYLYDDITFAVSKLGEQGVLFSEKKVFLRTINHNDFQNQQYRRAGLVTPVIWIADRDLTLWNRFRGGAVKHLEFDNIKFEKSAIYNIKSPTPNSATRESVGYIVNNPTLPEGTINFDDMLLLQGEKETIRGGVLQLSKTPLIESLAKKFEYLNARRITVPFNVGEIKQYASGYLARAWTKNNEYLGQIDGFKVKLLNSSELPNRIYANNNGNATSVPLLKYIQTDKIYVCDIINNVNVMYPVNIDCEIQCVKNTGGSSSDSNTGSTGGSTGESNFTGGTSSADLLKTSDAISSGFFGKLKNLGNGRYADESTGDIWVYVRENGVDYLRKETSSDKTNFTGGTSTATSTSSAVQEISRLDAMRSGLFNNLQNLGNGRYKNTLTGEIWVEFIKDGVEWLKKEQSTPTKTAREIEIQNKVFDCDKQFKPKTLEEYNNFAKARGGVTILTIDKVTYYEFGNGEIWKEVGLESPIMCPEKTKTIVPDGILPDGILPDGFIPDKINPDGFTPDKAKPTDPELPCCIQKNELGNLVYFYKGNVYSARITTDNEFVANMGDGWRLIKDCVPVEPNHTPSPCENYVRELARLQNDYSKLQGDLIEARNNANNNNYIDSLRKPLDDLRKNSLLNENDLITKFDDSKEMELKSALDKSRKRNKELVDEIEMLKRNDNNTLEQFYSYCCNDYDDCCDYDDDNY